MQQYRRSIILCEKCGIKFDVVFWNFVDAVQQPAWKGLLLDGQFFSHSCPRCMQQAIVPHALFYRDDACMLRVCFHPQETRRELFYTEAVEYFKEGYALRLLSSPSAFAEKLHLFDAGLNDKVIEIWKAEQLPRIARAFPGREVCALRYVPRESAQHIYFTIYAGSRQLNTIALKRAEYDARHEKLYPYLHMKEKPGRYLRVDQNFIKSPPGRFLLSKLKS